MIDICSIIQENAAYIRENNIFHFILDASERPWWSKQLEDYYINSGVKLNMVQNYKSQRRIMTFERCRKQFIDFVSDKQGVKVDLASGPSGYFSEIIENLTGNDLFIVTDACPTVVLAHSKACKKDNFYVFDVDLDKELPLKESSVDIFSGNLLSNVNNYASLLQEVYRCLKPGGHFSLIEMFFDYGCETYKHLYSKGEIWASFGTFVTFCEIVGFTFLGGDLISYGKGKISQGDLYPLDDNDCWAERTLYFMKPKI